MPWDTNEDAYKHNHKAKGKKARQWRHVANKELESGVDDATAIRIANGVIKKKSVFAELMDLAKGIGNDLVSNEVVTTRPFERKMATRQNAFSVRKQRKVRITPKSMMTEEPDE
jgi:hypothetical protein